MKQYRILLTSLGTTAAVGAIKALRNTDNANVFIVGTDINPRERIAGSSFCDKFVRIPRFDDARYVDTIKTICRLHDINFILPIHDYEVETLASQRDVFEGVKVCSSDHETVRICNDKIETNLKLQAEGVPTPAVWSICTDGPHQYSFPIFIKPRHGLGSKGCFQVDQMDELPFVLRRVNEPIAQAVLTGEQYVLDVLNDMDGRNLVVIPRIEYISKAGIGTNVRIQRQPQLEAYGARIAEALNIKGPANIEIFYNGSDIQLIEVNPRLSGGHIFSALAGVNLPLLTIKLFAGETINPKKLIWRDGININRYWEEAIDGGTLS